MREQLQRWQLLTQFLKLKTFWENPFNPFENSNVKNILALFFGKNYFRD